MKRKISTPLTITFIVVMLIIVVAVISQFFNTVHFYFNLADQSQAIVVDNSPKRLENPPKDIKAIYLTAYTASNDKRMTEIIDLVNKTELNAVVIDLKDYSGHILFDTQSDFLKNLGQKKF